MIEINNITNILINEGLLHKIAKKVLDGENVKNEQDLSIAFIGQGRMKEINKRYRGKNKATDVLSFSTFTRGRHKQFQKVQGLGEVIICLSEVKKNAKKFSSTFEKELAKILIHGILHLLGYDHEKKESEAKKMEEKEQYYLSQF